LLLFYEIFRLRSQCLKYPDRTETRQVHLMLGKSKQGQESYTQKMKQKIDSDHGRLIYSRRIGTAEPVFANLRHAIGLDRFTLRGNPKVNIQGNRGRSSDLRFTKSLVFDIQWHASKSPYRRAWGAAPYHCEGD